MRKSSGQKPEWMIQKKKVHPCDGYFSKALNSLKQNLVCSLISNCFMWQYHFLTCISLWGLRELREVSLKKLEEKMWSNKFLIASYTFFSGFPGEQALYNLRCNDDSNIPPVQLQTAKQPWKLDLKSVFSLYVRIWT